MKTPDILPFEPAEKRRALSIARDSGVLHYDDLDRLLVRGLDTQASRKALVRSLKNVVILDSRNPDDLLYEQLDTHAETPAAGSDDYRLFAQQVRSLRRLSRAEERLLARRLELARERFSELLDQAELPSEERERILDRGFASGDLHEDDADEAWDLESVRAVFPRGNPGKVAQSIAEEYARLRKHFVERNLYLVIGMAANYRTYGLPVMDLIQEGNASLIRAVEKFDWRKEVRFQTYATFWVRQAIERLITANRGMVRVPNYIQQKMRRFRREGKLPRSHKDMDVRDVSKLFEVSATNAARLMETDRGWFSLDVPLGEDNDSFASILEAEQEESSMAESELSDLSDALKNVMARHLSPQEREIIRKRFGLGGTKIQTLEQIGEQMGVSRERVRQMQMKAIGKLTSQGLLDELQGFL